MASTPDTTSAPTITLTPPDPVPVVAPAQASGLVPVAPELQSKLAAKVDAFVEELVSADAASPEFGKKVDQLTNMGRKEIAAAAGMSNRFLDRPVRAMDKDSGVGANLVELRRTIETLDPKRAGKLSPGKKLLGIIPFGNSLQRYFDNYTSAQGHIKAILDRLASGKDELLMDNAAIDVERGKLWEAMGQLEQMVHISRTLDGKLEEKAADLDASDPAKAKALRESALFYTRQRTQDLLTQMAVSVQGYLALDLVKKNNVELVKGVERASTTTVGALRTAVTVAQAMTNQRLVLQQITSHVVDATRLRLFRQIEKIVDKRFHAIFRECFVWLGHAMLQHQHRQGAACLRQVGMILLQPPFQDGALVAQAFHHRRHVLQILRVRLGIQQLH